MGEAKWQKYSALGGVAFVALNVVGGALAGQPPALDDPAEKITTYFQDHTGGLKASAVLSGLATVAILWWLSGLWRRLGDAEGGRPRLAVVSVLALVLGGAMYNASQAVMVSTAFRIDDLGDGSGIFYVLGSVLLAFAGFGIATHVLATTAVAFRTGLWPTWTNYLGLVAAVAFLIAGVLGTASDASGVVVVGFIGFIAWMIWLLVVSVVMFRSDSASA